MEQKESKGRAVTLVAMTVLSISSIVYAYTQNLAANVRTEALIKSKEEQVQLQERLKSCEDRNAMLEYRTEHLERSLENQTLMTEELLKRSK